MGRCRKAQTLGGGGERLSKTEEPQKPRHKEPEMGEDTKPKEQRQEDRDWRRDAGATIVGKAGRIRERESRAVREGGVGVRGEERKKRVMLDRREEVMGRRRR